MSPDVLFGWFVGGAIGTLLSIGVAGLMFIHTRRIQAECHEREKGLPTIEQVRMAEGQLVSLREQVEVARKDLTDAFEAVAKAELARKELEEIQARVRELEPMRAQLATVAAELAAARGNLEETRNDLTQNQQALITARAELERTTAENAKKLRDIGSECEALRTKLNLEISRERAELESQIGALKGALDRLTSENRAESDKLDAIHTELVGLTAAREELAQRVKALQDEVNGLSERREKAAAEAASLTAQVATLGAELKELQRSIDALKRERDSAQGELKSARVELEKTERKQREIEAESARCKQTLDNLHADLARKAPAANPKDRFSAVFEKPPLQHGTSLNSPGETEAIKRVEEYIAQCGFVYSPRVVRSFHTALKIGDRSPLLVLAGISGTGKTQLPRLYADALGIHFLPVAVQPGWDSPQDLLGFYSHLENRFRPTPMLQALCQMDPYMGSSTLKGGQLQELGKMWKETETSDQLLLVLLDEMNLARVEYYFSEFLSRLELRNSSGYNSDNPEDRKRAAFLMEGGPGAEALHLHVGHNVFFVGTMNEDETTQALSDKVVDRANVLRFATPRKLQAAPQTAAVKNKQGARLSRAAWHGWIKAQGKMKPVAGRELGAWIDELNAALGLVNRPFGHRTASAITQYVAQYPSLTSEGQMDALADQVEQRVMPKLRGIDPSTRGGADCVDRIKGIVEHLKDSRLLDAIKHGADANEGTQFVWFGVDRNAL